MPYAEKQKQKAYLRDYMRERQRKKKKEDEELKQRLHEIESLFNINYEYEVV